MQQTSQAFLKRPSIPWVILGVTFLLTLIAAGSVAENTRSRHLERFDNAVESTRSRIASRLDTYVTVMKSGVGLFAASHADVTRRDFQRFVENVDLSRRHPGMQGFGFTRRVRPAEEDSILASMREQGVPDFRFWPESATEERHAIIYLEPMDRRNEAAMGFNMYSEETRRLAMSRARDRAEAAMSGRVTLVQEIEGRRQAGFLVYLPVYEGGRIPPTVRQREDQLMGFIYAPFRADDLFSGIFRAEERPRLAFRIYDGPASDPENLIHDSRSAGIAPDPHSDYDYEISITMYGQTWTLTFAPTPSFASEGRAGTPFSIGVLGIILGLLLFALSRQQVVAEERVRKNEARLQAMVESVPVGMVVSDGAGRINFSNTAHRRIWGIRDPLPTDDPVEQDMPAAPDDMRMVLPAAAEMINRAMRGTPTVGMVMGITSRDGQERTTLNSFTPIYGAEGGVEMIIFAEVDITEQRRAEAALRERERELQTMVDAIPQLAWMADPSGNAIWFNRRWFDYAGCELSDLVGWGWTNCIHEDDFEHVERHLRDDIEQGVEWEDAMRLREKDGSYRDFLARAVPIVDDTGTIIRWFGTMTDITEELAARDAEARAEREQFARRAAEMREEQLKVHAAELERSNRELQDFAYVASHDLQEPLRKISTFTDLIVEEYSSQLGEEASMYLQRVQRSALRMSRLIKDLLSFSRVTTRSRPFEKVDLGEVMSEIISDLEVLIRDSDAEVIVEELPTIDADPMQMRQLFQNLVGNAVKFRQDDVPPRVVVRSGLPDNGTSTMCRIEVEDNGIGFEEKYLDRIFTPFQRLHAQSDYGGTGIGLAICRRIVERHRGRIWARSRPDDGSTFMVELPVHNSAGFEEFLPETIADSDEGVRG